MRQMCPICHPCLKFRLEERRRGGAQKVRVLFENGQIREGERQKKYLKCSFGWGKRDPLFNVIRPKIRMRAWKKNGNKEGFMPWLPCWEYPNGEFRPCGWWINKKVLLFGRLDISVLLCRSKLSKSAKCDRKWSLMLVVPVHVLPSHSSLSEATKVGSLSRQSKVQGRRENTTRQKDLFGINKLP